MTLLTRATSPAATIRTTCSISNARRATTFNAALAEQTETVLIAVPDANHFEVFAGLEEPDSPVWDSL